MSAAVSSPARAQRENVKRAPWPLIKCAVSHWSADQAATIGAALAFYCAFSIAPLLVILLSVAGWFVGVEAAYGHLSSQLTALFGKPTAHILLQAMRSSQTADGTIATLVSIGTLFLGATTVFAALEAALEQIWGARELVPHGFRGWVRARVLSFGLILAVGFLLLVSLSLSTALSALREGSGGVSPGSWYWRACWTSSSRPVS
jgi:membrane protein